VVATPPLEEDSTISDELLAQMLQQEMLAELERDTANHRRGTSTASVAQQFVVVVVVFAKSYAHLRVWVS
jgi:hypothetical protein